MKSMIIKLVPATIAMMVLACSDMKVEDDTERLSGFLPEDFTVSEFLELNPDVAGAQAMTTIGVMNVKWRDSLRADSIPADSITAWTEADKAAFAADTNLARIIYVTYLNGLATDTLGKNDLIAVGKFNIYGSITELAFIQNFVQTQIDSASAAETYVIFGLKEGRAYRKCTAADVLAEEKSIDLPGVLNAKTGARDYTCYAFCQEDTTVKPAKFFVVDRRCE